MSQRRAKRQRAAEKAQRPVAAHSRRAWTLAGIASALIVAGAVIGGIVLARGHRSPAVPIGITAKSSGPLSISGQDPITGRPVSLDAFHDKPIVLNVWASWCTGCRQEARDLASFERSHPGAQVIGVDTQDSDSAARSFYREFGWRHPSIRDPKGALVARLALQGLPTTFFLDGRHRIVAEVIGATTLAGFEQGLARASGPDA